eukprot:TRINITY_DN2969_c2_g8_i1.p1 TRINITY_DN2969_c2_g8~~TRINITY_DN2969_c2_g8_i1.p1  ORF type:complete len:308 (+),score=78.61 TRINITY_DN2969_c2_g8_i1:101-1024(+)
MTLPHQRRDFTQTSQMENNLTNNYQQQQQQQHEEIGQPNIVKPIPENFPTTLTSKIVELSSTINYNNNPNEQFAQFIDDMNVQYQTMGKTSAWEIGTEFNQYMIDFNRYLTAADQVIDDIAKRIHSTSLQKKINKHPKEVFERLNPWFLQHLDSPYVNSKSAKQLGKELGLTKHQIYTWFTNRRTRFKKNYYKGNEHIPMGCPTPWFLTSHGNNNTNSNYNSMSNENKIPDSPQQMFSNGNHSNQNHVLTLNLNETNDSVNSTYQNQLGSFAFSDNQCFGSNGEISPIQRMEVFSPVSSVSSNGLFL